MHSTRAKVGGENKMKTKLLALLLMAGSTVFAAPRVFFGVGIGVGGGYYSPAPPPPPPVVYSAPVYRPGYTWVGGYYYPVGPSWRWHEGYYARPPYAGAVWVGPRYYGRRYYRGYWR